MEEILDPQEEKLEKIVIRNTYTERQKENQQRAAKALYSMYKNGEIYPRDIRITDDEGNVHVRTIYTAPRL